MPSRKLRFTRSLIRGTWLYLFGRTTEQRIAGRRTMRDVEERMLRQMPRLERYVHSHSIRVWEDTRGFNRILRHIGKARFSIVVRIFIWRDDATGRMVAKLLTEAANRGVSVSITKEAAGDIFEGAEDFLSTKKRKSGVWKTLWNHPNIDVHYEAKRDHAKVFIFDESLLILTGMNIGDEYRWHWHDFVVELRGTHFVRQYLQPSRVTSGAVRLVANGTHDKNMRREVHRLLSSARHSIMLEHAYISDPEILRLLSEQSKRSISITIILPRHPGIHHHANMQFVDALLKSCNKECVSVLLYPGMIHSKVILVDRHKALIGSTNLMTSSLDDMGEVSVIFDGKPRRALRRIRAALRRDKHRSTAITNVPFRPLIRRFLAALGL